MPHALCSMPFGHLAKSAFAKAMPNKDKPTLIEQEEWLLKIPPTPLYKRGAFGEPHLRSGGLLVSPLIKRENSL